MSGTGQERMPPSDESLERLLGQAAPRLVPSARDTERLRDTVHAEWRAMTRKRQRIRLVTSLAAAAAIVAAVGLLLNTLRVPESDNIAVATIAKSVGSIYLLGQQSELREAGDLAAILPGETVVTGAKSGIGLLWSAGGSLRLDENTRITFLSRTEIALQSGRLYFDSQPSRLTSTSSATVAGKIVIHTDHGVVSQLGTQFMTSVDGRSLVVNVREGRVSIDGTHHAATAVAGEQLTITGRSHPVVSDVKVYGDPWQWIERISPPAELDGRSVTEFLRWVRRETGLGLRFDSDAAERLARSTILRGRIDAEPTRALGVWMLGVDLDWRVQDGVIVISKPDSLPVQ
jgi:hypothetical protein